MKDCTKCYNYLCYGHFSKDCKVSLQEIPPSPSSTNANSPSMVGVHYVPRQLASKTLVEEAITLFNTTQGNNRVNSIVNVVIDSLMVIGYLCNIKRIDPTNSKRSDPKTRHIRVRKTKTSKDLLPKLVCNQLCQWDHLILNKHNNQPKCVDWMKLKQPRKDSTLSMTKPKVARVYYI